MSGTDVEHYEGRGINYRALDDLFGIQQQRADEVRAVRLGMPCACALLVQLPMRWACHADL